MATTTVSDLLDRLASGDATLEETAEAFRDYPWAEPPPAPDEAQRWGIADDPAPDPRGWTAVDADSRLTTDQYETLAEAYGQARDR